VHGCYGFSIAESATCVDMTKSGAIAGKAVPVSLQTIKTRRGRQARLLDGLELGSSTAGAASWCFDAHRRFIGVTRGRLLPHRNTRGGCWRRTLNNNRGCGLHLGLPDLAAQRVRTRTRPGAAVGAWRRRRFQARRDGPMERAVSRVGPGGGLHGSRSLDGVCGRCRACRELRNARRGERALDRGGGR
jgi:hypothetical protein